MANTPSRVYFRSPCLEPDICETKFPIETDQTFNLFSQLNVPVISQISLRMLSKRQPVLSYHGLSNGLIMQERAAACPTCYQEAHTCFLNAVWLIRKMMRKSASIWRYSFILSCTTDPCLSDPVRIFKPVGIKWRSQMPMGTENSLLLMGMRIFHCLQLKKPVGIHKF